ncbi:MAG: hypothetical protein D6815_06130 [Candidatus Dadabacteria bacterium]|nr:MAG: hypothetical protein D6815_06130 [Candidatus Dadabacteria bacterium]
MIAWVHRALLIIATPLPSFLRVLLLRLLGHEIGRGTHISPFAVVLAPHVSIGEHSRIWPLCIVTSHSALRIGSYCQITPFAFVYGDSEFIMKDGSYIGTRAIINTTAPVTIGPNAGIGPSCMLYTHGVFLPYSHGYPRRIGPITLGENVWLMLGVSVLPGVTIGADSIVTGGLLISKDIPPHSYVQGQSSRLRIVSIELIKHHRMDELVTFATELLTGLSEVHPRFRYREEQPGVYLLTAGSNQARLRVVDGAAGSVLDPRAEGIPNIVFVRDCESAAWKTDGIARFALGDLRVAGARDPVSRFLRRELNRCFGLNFREIV